MSAIALGLAGLGTMAATAGGLYTNRENQNFAEEMSSTAYQRSVNDMRNAGLSPNAIFGSGGGSPASSPGGQQENAFAPFQNLAASAQQAVGINNAMKEGERIEAGTELTKAQADINKSNAKVAASEAEIATRENTAYKKALDTPYSGGIIGGLRKYFGGGMSSLVGSAANAIGRGFGNPFGGKSSAKGTPVTPEKAYVHRAPQKGTEIYVPGRDYGAHGAAGRPIGGRYPVARR